MLVLKAVVVWMLILVFAVLNGAVRERFLVPTFGAVPALITSGLLLSLAIVMLAATFVRWFGRRHASSYLRIGFLWLGLTLLFENSVGLFIQHKTWPELLDAYTFKGGNLWPLVLIVTTLAPLLAARLRGVLRSDDFS